MYCISLCGGIVCACPDHSTAYHPFSLFPSWNQDKKCEFPLCRKVPSYGYEGQRPRLCGEHKGHGMVNVSGTRESRVIKWDPPVFSGMAHSYFLSTMG